MPARQIRHTSPQVRREVVVTEAEEPMRIWPHPICCAQGEPCPEACPDGCPDLAQVAELLQCQNQLLVDLLGAVNSLTAALLCRNDKT